MTKSRFLLPSLFLVACAGSAAEDPDEVVAETAVDSALTGQSEAALAATLVADQPAAATPQELAQSIAQAATTRFVPAGCATATTSGPTTTVVFDGCTGTRGLVAVDGTIAITVTSVSGDSVGFAIHSTDFHVGGATLALALTGTYTAGETERLAIASTSSATGSFGHAVSHAGDYVVSWSASCASVDGSWMTTADGRTATLDVALERCAAACPIGSVTRTGGAGRTLDLVFDGTDRVAWSTGARSGTVPLPCSR